MLHPREVEGVLCAKEDEPWIGGNYEFGFKGDKGEVFGVDSDWPSTLLDASPESVPQELTRNVGTFSNTLTSKPITAENMKRAMDAIEARKNKTVFMPKPEFRYGIDYGFTPRIYDPEIVASPKAAPSVSTPVLRCSWTTQPHPGSLLRDQCTDNRAHAKSPYCETHIFEAMTQRDTEKREARKESPFQQSHCGRDGMLGVWSLRAR